MKQKILLVEDEATLAMIIKSYLDPYYNVFHAEDSKSALKVLEDTNIKAILLDLNLPGMHGFQLMQQIRDISRAIPILIVTGDAQQETVTTGLQMGAIDYIAKPVDKNLIQQRVKKAILKSMKD